MLMPTKASSSRPLSPRPALLTGTSLVSSLFAKRSSAGEIHTIDSRAWSLKETDFAIVALSARMKWQLHSGYRIVDGNPPCGRVDLHKPVEITEDGLNHGVDRVVAQALARYEKIDPRGRLDWLRLPLVGTCGNDRRHVGGIAVFHHYFLGYRNDPDRHSR